MSAISFVPLGVLCAALATIASADEPDALETNPLAAAFGPAPIWDVKLSPDGQRVSQIQMHPSGVSVARVLDLTTGAITPLLAGSHDFDTPADVRWCDWATDLRLVCGLGRLGGQSSGIRLGRLVGVDSDGANAEPLSGYGVVHWLPHDPNRVLVLVGNPNGLGNGVAYLDLDKGRITDEMQGPTLVTDWIADADGKPRLYRRTPDVELWYVRDTPSSEWSLLHKNALTDTEDAFAPIGFGAGENELLVFDSHEGRRALFALDLTNNRSRRLVYAHESLDVYVQFFGKYQRFVAASYVDDRTRFEFFDRRLKEIHAVLQAEFVGKDVSLIDEDLSQRYYLLFVYGADDPGTYYRFDVERNALLTLFPAYPQLAGRKLAPVRAVSYRTDDGTRVPAYLTLPNDEAKQPPPAVVLLHDGPSSRDFLRFDVIAQYLAANGYAVLQPNFRGSAGYGYEWLGQGGYRGWRRAISDIEDGTAYLVLEDIVDTKRICIAGWGYGGYAALMTAIENPGLYRCVVSIAGVTDTRELARRGLTYLGGVAERSFIGTGEEVFKAGSPLARAKEMSAPTLLFHGKADTEVRVQQSEDLAKALQRAGKDSVFVKYEHSAHDIRPDGDRIDLLTRLSAFLSEHLAN